MPNGDCTIGAKLGENVKDNREAIGNLKREIKDDIQAYKQELSDVDKKVDGLIIGLTKFKAEVKTSIKAMGIIGAILIGIVSPLVTTGLITLVKYWFGG